MIPTGTSDGTKAVRAMVSASIKNIPPTSAEVGSEHAMVRSHQETHGVRNDHPDESDHPAERHDRARQQRRNQKDGSLGSFGIDPSDRADSSPKAKMFNTRTCLNSSTRPTSK